MKERLKRERTRSSCTWEHRTLLDELELVRCVLFTASAYRMTFKLFAH